MNPLIDIGSSDKNISIPFYPSSSWKITQAFDPESVDPESISAPWFSYIQAVFNETDTPNPIIAVWNGQYDSDGNPIGNPICFAYSGELRHFKGYALLTSANDRNGNAIDVTAFGSFSYIQAYGGTQ